MPQTPKTNEQWLAYQKAAKPGICGTDIMPAINIRDATPQDRMSLIENQGKATKALGSGYSYPDHKIPEIFFIGWPA